MKLQDCDCGGTAQVTYDIDDNAEFVVGCAICGNQTPVCESLREAVSLWNQVYCCVLPPNETAPA